MPIEGKLGSLYIDKEQTQPLFPRTKTKAITDDDNIRLDITLDSLKTTVNSKASEAFVMNAIANAQLGGGEGEIDLSSFATKDELNNISTEFNTKISSIDFPVDSINNKTGAVTLSATDVGARPDTWTPTAEEVGAVDKTGDTMTGSLKINGSWKGVNFGENAAILNAGTRLSFDQRPQNSTGSHERYVLPTPTKRTADVWYNILTSKNPVTIEQGGLGGTDRLSSAKNLTNEAVSSPNYVVSLTSSWGKFGYTSLAQLMTALGAASATPSISSANNSFHYAHLAKIGKLVICTLMPKTVTTQSIYEETITIPSGYRPSANKSFTFYSDTAKNAGSSNGLVTVSVATGGALKVSSTYGVTVKEASQTYCWVTA